jgi:hypothetical protein
MKQLYLDIKTKIESDCPEIKLVRLFNNQFERSNNDDENLNDEQAFPYPCAFIEFPEDNEPISSGYGARRLNVLVRVHIGFESYLLEDTDVFDIANSVYQALDGWKASASNEFQYEAQRMDYNHNNVYVYQYDFRTVYADDSNYIKDKLTLKNTSNTLKLNVNLDIDNAIIRTGDGVE